MIAAARYMEWVLGLAAFLALAACGEVQWGQDQPWVPTPVPADFAVVIDEAPETFYARQNVHQVVTAADLMSRTTYTTLSDYRNGVASSFTAEQPLTAGQLQALWNEVVKNDLLSGARVWYFWKTNPDNYLRDERRIQIRANGQVAEYTVLNHWGYRLRELAFQIGAARLPVTHPGAPLPSGTQPTEGTPGLQPPPAASAPATP